MVSSLMWMDEERGGGADKGEGRTERVGEWMGDRKEKCWDRGFRWMVDGG
jgi:hypothetical protein